MVSQNFIHQGKCTLCVQQGHPDVNYDVTPKAQSTILSLPNLYFLGISSRILGLDSGKKREMLDMLGDLEQPHPGSTR